jgi:hypothetical protein
MTRAGTAEVRWPRIYRMLTAAGHDPAKAAEILLDAQRKDNHARAWIKAVLACERLRSEPQVAASQPVLSASTRSKL